MFVISNNVQEKQGALGRHDYFLIWRANLCSTRMKREWYNERVIFHTS
jgi:hypothetical protein